MKKTLALLLALLMVFALFGCTGGDDASNTTGSDTSDDSTATGGEAATIIYLCSSMTIQWCQDIATTLESFESELGFDLIAAESGFDNEKMITLVETYADEGVDGFIINTSEDINARLYEIANAAGIPVLFESTTMKDTDGNLLTSGVELNAYDCGSKSAQYIVDNYQDLGYTVTDQSKVGFIAITYSVYASFVARSNGASDAFAAEFPDATYFTADLVSQGDMSAEAAYAEVAAIIASNPSIEMWAIVGVLDDWAMGAARAVEDASLEDSTMITSVGGELLVNEWANAYEGCWVACAYFNAMDYAELLAPAMMQVVNGEATVEDLWPEWKVEGSNFSSYQVTGTLTTKDTYEEIAAQ